MQVAVRGKNIEITGALREYLEKKLGKIEKFIDQPMNAQANLYVERGRHIVEITFNMNGLMLRAEESNNDMYASIDLATDKLEKQVHKYRARVRRHADVPAAPVAEEPAEKEGSVVKTKRFPVKPQTVEEAAMQMDLLSHDFFVFVNSETHRVNVVYRRKDGDYGLLEPDY